MKKLSLLSLLFVSSIQPSDAWSKAKLGLGIGALSAVILGTGVLIMDKYGALEIMLYNHQFFAVRLLLRSGLLRIQDNLKYFTDLLHYSVINKDEAIVKFLLENGVGVNFKDDSCDSVAMHYALDKQQSISMLQLLLRFKVNVHFKDESGNTLLHFAVLHRRSTKEQIQLLLDSGVDVFIKNDAGRTALEEAKLINHAEIIEVLKQAENLHRGYLNSWSHLIGNESQGVDVSRPYANPEVTAQLNKLLHGHSMQCES